MNPDCSKSALPHIYTPEQEAAGLKILESIHTAQEAVWMLLTDEGTAAQFWEVSGVLAGLLESIRQSALPYRELLEAVKLPLACQSAGMSLQSIRDSWEKDRGRSRMKLQFELLPALENAYMEFYFWSYVYTHPDRERQYYEEELPELASNFYINEAMESGNYKYDVSFMVLAYNKLEYTKMCVESLLRNIPDGLRYELILWDNGSSDETRAYFEGIKPDKLLESRINWSVGL